MIQILGVQIYDMIDSVSTSPYDRPTRAIRSSWTAQEHFSCFVYQASKNLAAISQPLAPIFHRQSLKTKTGQKKAIQRIRGIILIGTTLVNFYVQSLSDDKVELIESLRPVKNPEWSPIAEVRARYQPNKLVLAELRKWALDSSKEKNEKSWLINNILRNYGMSSEATKSKVEHKAGEVTSTKRMAETLEKEAAKYVRIV